MPITIECSIEELELLLHAARESGDCLLILHGGDGETVCLRARAPRKPGRPRKVQAAAEGLDDYATQSRLSATLARAEP